MSEKVDLYKLLGVDEKADKKALRKAYHRLALKVI